MKKKKKELRRLLDLSIFHAQNTLHLTTINAGRTHRTHECFPVAWISKRKANIVRRLPGFFLATLIEIARLIGENCDDLLFLLKL